MGHRHPPFYNFDHMSADDLLDPREPRRPKRSKNYWDALATEYDSLYTGLYSSLENAAVLGIIDQWTAGRYGKGASLLDIGCGTGLFAGYYKGIYDYHGVDVSQGMLDIAREKYEDYDTRFNLIKPHMGLQELPAAAYDVAIATFGVLSYVTLDMRIYAEQVARVLRPGGVFVLMGLSRYALWRFPHFTERADGQIRGKQGAVIPTRYFTPSQLLEAFQPIADEVKVQGLSFGGHLWENPRRWRLDRRLAEAFPRLAYNLVVTGVTHA